MPGPLPPRGGNNMRFDPNSLVLFVDHRRADATYLVTPLEPPNDDRTGDPAVATTLKHWS